MEQAAEKEDFERKVNNMIFFLFRSLAFFFCCLSSLSSSQPFCCLVTSSRNFPTGRHARIKDVCRDVWRIRTLGTKTSFRLVELILLL